MGRGDSDRESNGGDAMEACVAVGDTGVVGDEGDIAIEGDLVFFFLNFNRCVRFNTPAWMGSKGVAAPVD